MIQSRCKLSLVVLALLCAGAGSAQQADQPVVSRGQVMVDGADAPYEVRHLPVSSFPDLPPAIAGQLHQRGCLVPQTYEARRPENVVHASLEHPGSSDWAVLCSVDGQVALLVFFASAPDAPMTLGQAPETQRLQKHPSSPLLGFNWGIDPASPATVRQAQIGLSPRPAKLDHDALTDSIVDHRTIYHFYRNSAWTLLDMPQ